MQTNTRPTHSYTICLIAGESSGDMIGGKLMASLKALSSKPIQFIGIGGSKQQAEQIISKAEETRSTMISAGGIRREADRQIAELQILSQQKSTIPNRYLHYTEFEKPILRNQITRLNPYYQYLFGQAFRQAPRQELSIRLGQR